MPMEDLESFLREKPEYLDILLAIIKYEEQLDPSDVYFLEDTPHNRYWENTDVPVNPTRLHHLETVGVLDRVLDTNSTTAYSINDREEMKEQVTEINDRYDGDKEVIHHNFPTEEELDEDIFEDVIGYDDIKWLLRRGLTTDEITNFLLVGPPGSAKTVFLLCIRRLQDAVFVPAADSSSAGFLEAMFEHKPKYVLLDEVDDMNADNQKSLSSYMETGIVKETKYEKSREMEINAKTFGSANSTSPIQDHILDRFTVLQFDKYTRDEFIEVCKHMLPDKEDVSEGEAKKIAELLWDKERTADVRKAIAVARLSRGDPERVIDVMDKYSPDKVSF